VDEFSSKGIFSGGQGYAFRRKKIGRLDQFAELMSEHDLETGDVGGNAGECAIRMGLHRRQGNLMLQRLRKGLGWQAQ
jgi:hypothetical protein